MLNELSRLFRPYRSQAEASAMLGKTIRLGNQSYQVTGFNDLGCLYGVKVNGRRKGKREYVLD